MIKVLVVEDNRDNMEVMRTTLTHFGYEIVEAVNGKEGIEKAKAVKPDLIIVDTVLPGLDGFGICKTIRQTLDLKNVKIIIITGFIDAVDAVMARRMGADEYVVKTEDYTELIEVITKLTG